jgi:hypothetical protein
MATIRGALCLKTLRGRKSAECFTDAACYEFHRFPTIGAKTKVLSMKIIFIVGFRYMFIWARENKTIGETQRYIRVSFIQQTLFSVP